MFVTLVHVHVKPAAIEPFIAATRANHEASVREPGNLRFDVIRSVDEPDRFILYEWYADEAAALAHKETAHYAAWRDAVAPMLAEPRTSVKYANVFPGDARWG